MTERPQAVSGKAGIANAGHDPLPWEAASDGCLRRAGQECGFLKIASPWIESAWDGDEAALSNAAFIVRACNSHYELLEALSWFVDDERFQVAVGGNPAAVERMIADAQAVYAKARQP